MTEVMRLVDNIFKKYPSAEHDATNDGSSEKVHTKEELLEAINSVGEIHIFLPDGNWVFLVMDNDEGEQVTDYAGGMPPGIIP